MRRIGLTLSHATPLLLLAAVGCSDARASSVAPLTDALSSRFTVIESVQVLINLPEPKGPFESRTERRGVIERMQDDVLGSLGSEFTLKRRYGHVPALAGVLTRSGAKLLQNDPRVISIQLDTDGGGQLKEAVPAIGGDRVHDLLHITGKGVRVAILDTGADTDHPDLKSAIVAQHCFTQGDCGTFSSEGTKGEDDHGHGSNVAGIVGSRGMVAPTGFAPEAELVIVKVNDQNDSGQESDWVAGLDWVFDNLGTTHVKVLNLSLGTNALYTGNCDAQEPAMASALKNLIDAGVTVFAASGNRGSSTQMGAPACNGGVIAVGAVYDSDVGFQPPMAATYSARWGSAFASCADQTTAFDQITCFTNSSDRLDIVAPGAPITSDSLNGRTDTYWGTSQASPAAAAVAALMLQCNGDLSPAKIKDIMKSTGVMRLDPKNMMMFPSLRAYEAVQAACSNAPTAQAGSGGAAPLGVAGMAGNTPPALTPGGSVAPPPAAGVAAPAGNTGSATVVSAGRAAAGTSAPTVAGRTAAGTPAAAAGSGTPATTQGAAAPPPPPSGCSCRVAETGHTPAGGLASAGLALAAWTTRRRQRRLS